MEKEPMKVEQLIRYYFNPNYNVVLICVDSIRINATISKSEMDKFCVFLELIEKENMDIVLNGKPYTK